MMPEALTGTMRTRLISLLLLVSNHVFPCETDKTSAVVINSAGLRGVTFRADPSFGINYPMTRCISVATTQAEEAGLICRSRSSQFLKDNGVDNQNTSDPTKNQNTAVTVSTSMSLYEMQERSIEGAVLYSADIDCDTENQPIYRANSTCHVTYWPLSEGWFIYTNMTIENPASHQPVISKEKIDRILSRIEK